MASTFFKGGKTFNRTSHLGVHGGKGRKKRELERGESRG